MKKGLFSKMVATFTGIIAISFIITATVLSYWFENYYFEQRKNQLMSEGQYIGVGAVKYLKGDFTSERIGEVLNGVASYLSSDIWLTDNYGIVYAVSNPRYNKLIGKQVLTNELEQLRFGKDIEKRSAYSEVFKESVHTFMIPIFNNGTFKGAAVMYTSIDEIKEPLNKVYQIIWLSAILAIIISGFIIYYFAQRIIIKPLGKINCVADKISKGEVDKRVHIQSNDEIGELSKSFNLMAESLEKIEVNRRQFISNASHEIRSPLTSIKGFIGGILDGIVPNDKTNYYLNLAYDEIKRLTRLVNNLLDLSSIEAGQLKLNIEEVNINEIIRLCIIKFENKIKNKKIQVEVILQDDDLYVVADKDRLTQVVVNLIDNALKYGEDEGKIKIDTKSKGQKVYVSIFNTGQNISSEDLKNIWSRFYKADKARSSKVSTGLGLSIVRNILTELGEDIWVENKENGVNFTFTLKKM